MLLVLKSVDAMKEQEVEQEYSHLVQILENRSHNVHGSSVLSYNLFFLISSTIIKLWTRFTLFLSVLEKINCY